MRTASFHLEKIIAKRADPKSSLLLLRFSQRPHVLLNLSFLLQEMTCYYVWQRYWDNLEDTLAVTEGGNMAGGVLLVHGLASEDLSDHVAHDTHHSGTAVVDLNVELAGLVLRVEDVRAEVSDAVVAVVLGGGHPGELDKSEESKDLEKTSSAAH